MSIVPTNVKRSATDLTLFPAALDSGLDGFILLLPGGSPDCTIREDMERAEPLHYAEIVSRMRAVAGKLANRPWYEQVFETEVFFYANGEVWAQAGESEPVLLEPDYYTESAPGSTAIRVEVPRLRRTGTGSLGLRPEVLN